MVVATSTTGLHWTAMAKNDTIASGTPSLSLTQPGGDIVFVLLSSGESNNGGELSVVEARGFWERRSFSNPNTEAKY